jgi:folate-dependent phosphoribosylglycinamide formyltransferase PurN
MPRIALLTIECAQTAEALTEIIERHHDEIAVVITSDVYKTARGGLLKQTRSAIASSGLRFMPYLTYSFVVYPMLLQLDRLQSLLTRRRRRRSVATLCAEYGIEHIRTGRVNSPEVIARLEAAELDHVVIYWFDQIIHEKVIKTARRGVVNIHAAHLPNCRGLFPTLFSALEPGTPFGATAHMIEDRAVDAGPILAQTAVEVPPGRSVLFTDAWVNRAGVGLVGHVLRNFDALHEARQEQSGGSYYSYPTREQLAEAKRMRLRLATFRDFLAVLRGTGAADGAIRSAVDPVKL